MCVRARVVKLSGCYAAAEQHEEASMLGPQIASMEAYPNRIETPLRLLPRQYDTTHSRSLPRHLCAEGHAGTRLDPLERDLDHIIGGKGAHSRSVCGHKDCRSYIGTASFRKVHGAKAFRKALAYKLSCKTWSCFQLIPEGSSAIRLPGAVILIGPAVRHGCA